jgi:Lar family restriction alleviation protein
MQINRCPKCGREPSVVKTIDYTRYKVGYEIRCYDCKILTEATKTRDEAVAKWNEMTEGESNEQ